SPSLCRSADAVFLRPAEAGEGVALWPVLAADPALVADLVEQIEQIRVMDLADIRLVPSRIAGDLDMRVMAGERAHLGREIALHDLHVIEVELQLEVWPADPLDDAQCLRRVVQEIAGDIASIDRLDDGSQPRPGHPVGGP